MNITKLKAAETQFMDMYPGGFKNPEMIEIGKKHKMEKMVEFVAKSFSKEAFDNPATIVENMIKVVSSSSMVSLFEKPKFRDFARSLSPAQKQDLSASLQELLYGDEEQGFNMLVDILKQERIAKWPVVTVFGVYFRPQKDLLVKPTTVKNIIQQFELEDIVYKPEPTYAFYKKYRTYINKMKKEVSSSLSPSNAAFSGFLMMVS
jgi:hypothetical protein